MLVSGFIAECYQYGVPLSPFVRMPFDHTTGADRHYHLFNYFRFILAPSRGSRDTKYRQKRVF